MAKCRLGLASGGFGKLNVLIEAVGSPVWGATLPWLRQAVSKIVGLDIDPLAFGLYVVDRPYLVPQYGDPACFDRLRDICQREEVGLVYPSVNEGLLEWARRQEELAREGVRVIISPMETVAACIDKWETYQFFARNGIPTPATSLEQRYRLLKPRVGRGGQGIRLLEDGEKVDMQGFVTQELLEGQEYSVDSLCSLEGEVIYVVPRKRLVVESGLSVKGEVVKDEEIETLTRRILAAAAFVGPVNIQCFRTRRGVFFTEINPRLAGGMSLSMAATDNWFTAIARMLAGERVEPAPVRHGMVMMRFLSDCIVEKNQLLS